MSESRKEFRNGAGAPPSFMGDASPREGMVVTRAPTTSLLRRAIVLALLAAAPLHAADVATGKTTYGELCAKCHGSGGKGDGKEAATLETKPKDLTDCARMAKFSDDQLLKIVKEGGAASDLSKDMPPYKDSLEDDEIADTVAYIRSLCPR